MPLEACTQEQHDDALDMARTLLGHVKVIRKRRPNVDTFDHAPSGLVTVARATYRFRGNALLSVTHERDLQTIERLAAIDS